MQYPLQRQLQPGRYLPPIFVQTNKERMGDVSTQSSIILCLCAPLDEARHGALYQQNLVALQQCFLKTSSVLPRITNKVPRDSQSSALRPKCTKAGHSSNKDLPVMRIPCKEIPIFFDFSTTRYPPWNGHPRKLIVSFGWNPASEEVLATMSQSRCILAQSNLRVSHTHASDNPTALS